MAINSWLLYSYLYHQFTLSNELHLYVGGQLFSSSSSKIQVCVLEEERKLFFFHACNPFIHSFRGISTSFEKKGNIPQKPEVLSALIKQH